ncbi:WASH complex subunit 7, partial [Kipferlia bialata]
YEVGDAGEFAWPSKVLPVTIDAMGYEQAAPAAVIEGVQGPRGGDSHALSQLRKVVLVFGVLGREVHRLSAFARDELYAPILMFGDTPTPVPNDLTTLERITSGIPQLQVARMLPFLHRVFLFTNRCYEVFRRYIESLAGLTSLPIMNSFASRNSLQLQDVYSAIGDLLGILSTIDFLVGGNTKFNGAWKAYKLVITRALQNAASDP